MAPSGLPTWSSFTRIENRALPIDGENLQFWRLQYYAWGRLDVAKTLSNAWSNRTENQQWASTCHTYQIEIGILQSGHEYLSGFYFWETVKTTNLSTKDDLEREWSLMTNRQVSNCFGINPFFSMRRKMIRFTGEGYRFDDQKEINLNLLLLRHSPWFSQLRSLSPCFCALPICTNHKRRLAAEAWCNGKVNMRKKALASLLFWSDDHTKHWVLMATTAILKERREQLLEDSCRYRRIIFDGVCNMFREEGEKKERVESELVCAVRQQTAIPSFSNLRSLIAHRTRDIDRASYVFFLFLFLFAEQWNIQNKRKIRTSQTPNTAHCSSFCSIFFSKKSY